MRKEIAANGFRFIRFALFSGPGLHRCVSRCCCLSSLTCLLPLLSLFLCDFYCSVDCRICFFFAMCLLCRCRGLFLSPRSSHTVGRRSLATSAVIVILVSFSLQGISFSPFGCVFVRTVCCRFLLSCLLLSVVKRRLSSLSSLFHRLSLPILLVCRCIAYLLCTAAFAFLAVVACMCSFVAISVFSLCHSLHCLLLALFLVTHLVVHRRGRLLCCCY